MCTAGFPEPRTFSRRVQRILRKRAAEFDVVHDNQSLGRGLLRVRSAGLPLVATIHHPISVDRAIDLAGATGLRRVTLRRWYGFLPRRGWRIDHLVTPSTSSARDAIRDFSFIPPRQIAPNGVDTDCFRPLGQRIPGSIITLCSADVPIKGLAVLLQAMALLPADLPTHLTVVSKPAPGSDTQKLVRGGPGAPGQVPLRLDHAGCAMATHEVACVPSLYEGFSLPAVEAMASGTALVASDSGALPEVVGRDGGCGVLVPPGDVAGCGPRQAAGGSVPAGQARRGRSLRAVETYSWAASAASTVAVYRRAIAGLSPCRRPRASRRGVVLTVDFERFPVDCGDRLLDLGCGAGRHTYEALRRGADVVALDQDVAEIGWTWSRRWPPPARSPSGPARCRSRVTHSALPFPDASFSRVIAAEVLEHIPDDSAAIAEIARVVAPGGLVAVTVPRRWTEQVCWRLSDAYHEVEGGHIRIYRGETLVTALRAARLGFVGRHHAHALHSPYWWLKCGVGVDRRGRCSGHRPTTVCWCGT